MTEVNAQAVEAQQIQFIACAYVYEGPSGSWIVQDEMDNRGGLFTDRKAALKFVRHEFGPDAEIVMAAPSPASDETITAKSNHLQILPGYGLPFSIVLIKRELDQWKPGEHNGTFRGNNMAFITAATMLEHYWKDGKFESELKAKSAHLRKRLEAMVEQHSSDLVDVKVRGFMIGVRCADADQAAMVTKNAFTEGLIIERCGPNDEIVKCMMPLTTTMAEIDEGLDILERVFEGLFNRDAWDENVHDISDAASLKGCWDVAAQLLIQQAEQTAATA